MPRILSFTDEFAPHWTDPESGQGGPWTAARFRAAGFEVRELPGVDWYAVDLDSRRAALDPAPDDWVQEDEPVPPIEAPQPHEWNTD